MILHIANGCFAHSSSNRNQVNVTNGKTGYDSKQKPHIYAAVMSSWTCEASKARGSHQDEIGYC